jgi:hypothetical protein
MNVVETIAKTDRPEHISAQAFVATRTRVGKTKNLAKNGSNVPGVPYVERDQLICNS